MFHEVWQVAFEYSDVIIIRAVNDVEIRGDQGPESEKQHVGAVIVPNPLVMPLCWEVYGIEIRCICPV